MENKFGYVIITTEEYRELIENERKNERHIEELDKSIKEKYEMMETISGHIKDKDEYEIGKLELEEDGTVKENYIYEMIVDDFKKLGISDEEFVNKKIKEFYDNREIEK